MFKNWRNRRKDRHSLILAYKLVRGMIDKVGSNMQDALLAAFIESLEDYGRKYGYRDGVVSFYTSEINFLVDRCRFQRGA